MAYSSFCRLSISLVGLILLFILRFSFSCFFSFHRLFFVFFQFYDSNGCLRSITERWTQTERPDQARPGQTRHTAFLQLFFAALNVTHESLYTMPNQTATEEATATTATATPPFQSEPH